MSRRKITTRTPRERYGRDDLDELPVQLNIRVPYWFREHLMRTAETEGVSLSKLCRDAIERAHPLREPR